LPLHHVVDHLQDLVLKTDSVKVMLDELAAFSAITLADPATAFCSITLIQRKKPVTVASSQRGEADAGLNLYSTRSHGFGAPDPPP
jgi:hypothetical protein